MLSRTAVASLAVRSSSSSIPVSGLARTRWISSQSDREAERQAKQARRDAIAKKRAEVSAYLASMYSKDTAKTTNGKDDAVDKTKSSQTLHQETEKSKQEEQWQAERQALLEEAGFMTRSLFRTCLRCVKLLRPGNEHDEREFQEREEAQLKEMEEKLSSSSFSFSMEPPVDRENELESRFEYYHGWTRENFEGELDSLKKDPWREEDVERYVYFLRKGEERRKWLLKEYRFEEDPFPHAFDHDRVDQFEARANELLVSIYGAKGWLHSKDIKPEDINTGRDDFFDADDNPDDVDYKLKDRRL